MSKKAFYLWLQNPLAWMSALASSWRLAVFGSSKRLQRTLNGDIMTQSGKPLVSQSIVASKWGPMRLLCHSTICRKWTSTYTVTGIQELPAISEMQGIPKFLFHLMESLLLQRQCHQPGRSIRLTIQVKAHWDGNWRFDLIVEARPFWAERQSWWIWALIQLTSGIRGAGLVESEW